jgi:hypothetical protein
MMILVIAIAIAGIWLLLSRFRRDPGMAGLEVEPGVGTFNLEDIRRQDPELTEERISRHTAQMADILREAWCAGDMRPARSFVSDGVFCRYTTQLALMRASGKRNVMADAKVVSVTIESVEIDAPLEIIRLRLDAQARDRMVSLDASPGQVAEALRHAPIEPYSEIWSLVRRQGARTQAAPVRVGQACPSCGAPLGAGEVVQCQYCHALVNSGAYDWVLAEITQLSAWHPSAAQAIPGFSALRAADPGLAAAVLEDRASYLFWKWIEASIEGSATPLRKCATAAFQSAMPAAPGLLDVAVGGVDLVECVPAREPGGMDTLVARVYWSASSSRWEASAPRMHALQLVRRHGVKSEPSFSALHCQNCGAPLGASDSDQCDHCHAKVATGDQSWVLDRVVAG